MIWVIFAFVSIASISVANLYQRIAMKQSISDPYASSIIFQILVTLVTFVFVIFHGISLPSSNLVFNVLISTSLYAGGTLAYFHALKAIEASESAILASFGGLVTITSAYAFLGERLNSLQLFGVFIIIFGVLIITASSKKIRFNKGMLFAILGAALYGLATTNDTFILHHSADAITYTSLISLTPGILLLIIHPKAIKSIIATTKNPAIMKPLILYFFFYWIQAITYFLSLASGAKASQLSILFKLEIISTVILATIFLRERDNLPRKIIATIIVSIGAYLLI